MPELLTKIEGKGNGIKTVLPNISDVARALSRPPTCTLQPVVFSHTVLGSSYSLIDIRKSCTRDGVDPTKFFGCELGAQTPMDEKNDRYIVNGAHEAVRLRELLDVFIDKFVLCGSCKNPETDLIVEKNGDYIYRDCKACGKKTDIDMRHKLSTYIVRNPPKTAKGKRSKGAHASANTNGGTGTPGSGDDGKGSGEDVDDADAFTKKLKSDAAVLPTAEQAGIDENDWSLDTSADAVRARAKLEGAMGSLTLGDDDENEEDDADSPYTQLKVWTTENRANTSAVEVFKKTQELGIEKKHKTLQVLARYLFTQEVVTQLPTFTPLFQKVSLANLCPCPAHSCREHVFPRHRFNCLCC